jgi:hypothetical protein
MFHLSKFLMQELLVIQFLLVGCQLAEVNVIKLFYYVPDALNK